MDLSGYEVKDTNLVFRLLVISVAGIAAFAVIVSWRAQVLINAQYQEFPRSHKINNELIIRQETETEKQQRIDQY